MQFWLDSCVNRAVLINAFISVAKIISLKHLCLRFKKSFVKCQSEAECWDIRPKYEKYRHVIILVIDYNQFIDNILVKNR